MHYSLKNILKTKSLTIFLSFIIILTGCNNQSNEATNIVVAANMKLAMDSIATIYALEYPDDQLQITYGSSGKLYEQIGNSAPFDLFFSADIKYPNKLEEKKLTASKIKVYAIGKLALWSKKEDPNLKQINTLLQKSIKKIAIANPKTAPYGEKSLQALEYYKIHHQVEHKLVYGENIAQTAQFVTSGNADIGIIALSDAMSPALKKLNGKFYMIPHDSYQPLEQACVILKEGKDNPVAQRFFDYISTDKAKSILSYFGYGVK